MPNGDVHRVTGLLAGGLTSLMVQKQDGNEELSLGQVVLCGTAGGLRRPKGMFVTREHSIEACNVHKNTRTG